jgi:hypothetical protein
MVPAFFAFTNSVTSYPFLKNVVSLHQNFFLLPSFLLGPAA